MLEIGKANEVKFKVAVNGTQAQPSVRLVLVTPQADLGFPAEKLIGGEADDWFSEVKIPEDLSEGDYDFRVEVVINNRLFTPIKRRVTVGVNPELVAAKQDVEAKLAMQTEEVSTPPTPTQKPRQTETWEGEGGALPVTPEKPQPLPSKPLDPLKPAKSLMAEAASKDNTTPHRPKAKKVEPVAPVKPVERKPAPKKQAVKPEPVRITMADIAAESEKRFGEVLKESASYKSPAVAATPINIKQEIPVTLTKGDIIYE